MPKAVLWDFGNVIVRWDPRTLYSKIFPDPAERDRFLGEVCTMAWHAPTDCGVSFAENCARLTALHPHHAPHTRSAVFFSALLARPHGKTRPATRWAKNEPRTK